MPNWVFSSVVISGEKSELDKLQAQLNKPVTKNFPDSNYNQETKKWEHTPATQHYSNPVFSFWNVIAPTDLEAYYGEDKDEKSDAFSADGSFDNNKFIADFNTSLKTNENWYWWNLRNWGTKWDIAVVDGKQEYSSTNLEITDEGDLMYHFETAWSPVFEIFDKLSEQYPSLTFDYEYEEEQGWGGEATWSGGSLTYEDKYDIPSSHADYAERGREDSCNCMHEDDQEYWFVDCPREVVGA